MWPLKSSALDIGGHARNEGKDMRSDMRGEGTRRRRYCVAQSPENHFCCRNGRNRCQACRLQERLDGTELSA